MGKRKFSILLCLALVVAVALFGVTEGKAGTTATISGWDVTLSTPADNTYVYTFTQRGGDKISFVEILVPSDLKVGTLTSINTYMDNVVVIPSEIILGPTGDGSTGFGIGLPNWDLIKLKSDNARSFPLGEFSIKIEIVLGVTPPNGFELGAASSVMLVKSGNGQVWGTATIDLPAFVPIPPPPPPIGIDTEYLSVENHSDYLMQVNKDLYGNLVEICLVTNPDHTKLVCTTGGEKTYDVPGDGTIRINLGDLGDTLIVCTSGDPKNPSSLIGCDYLTFATESEVKGGNSTCGFKLKSGRYAYTCW